MALGNPTIHYFSLDIEGAELMVSDNKSNYLETLSYIMSFRYWRLFHFIRWTLRSLTLKWTILMRQERGHSHDLHLKISTSNDMITLCFLSRFLTEAWRNWKLIWTRMGMKPSRTFILTQWAIMSIKINFFHLIISLPPSVFCQKRIWIQQRSVKHQASLADGQIPNGRSPQQET